MGPTGMCADPPLRPGAEAASCTCIHDGAPEGQFPKGAPSTVGSARHQNVINDLDHAIGLMDVGDGDIGHVALLILDHDV